MKDSFSKLQKAERNISFVKKGSEIVTALSAVAILVVKFIGECIRDAK